MTYNVSLELFGIAVMLPMLYCLYAEPYRDEKPTRLLRYMTMLNICVLLCDALTWLLDGKAQLTVLLYILNALVYSLGYVITALFTWYLVRTIAERTRANFHTARCVSYLCALAVLMVVISLFNHMYFSIENGVYVRGSLYWLSQAFPIGIILLDMYMTLRYRKALGKHDTLVLLSYGVLPVLAMLIQIFFYGITLLYLSTTLALLIIYMMMHSEKAYRLKVKENEITQMQVSIMLSQIQPHFLYNALNTIRVLCDKDPHLAGSTVSRFAKYLRGNMDSLTQTSPIPMDKELEHLECYLDIERLRFPDVKIVYDLRATDFTLPALTIQPLVENAVRYGVGCRERGGTVTISSWEDGGYAHIRVSDDGDGFDPRKTQHDGRSHIGIDNTRSRLASMCDGTLEVHSDPESGTQIDIMIPEER